MKVGLSGGDKRDRTADLLNAIQALSQLSYTPIFGSLSDSFCIITRYRKMSRGFSYFSDLIFLLCSPCFPRCELTHNRHPSVQSISTNRPELPQALRFCKCIPRFICQPVQDRSGSSCPRSGIFHFATACPPQTSCSVIIRRIRPLRRIMFSQRLFPYYLKDYRFHNAWYSSSPRRHPSSFRDPQTGFPLCRPEAP